MVQLWTAPGSEISQVYVYLAPSVNLYGSASHDTSTPIAIKVLPLAPYNHRMIASEPLPAKSSAAVNHSVVSGYEPADLKWAAWPRQEFYLHGCHMRTHRKHTSHRDTADARPTSRPTAAEAEPGRIRDGKRWRLPQGERAPS